MVATFFSKWHYVTTHIIILFEPSWYLFVCFKHAEAIYAIMNPFQYTITLGLAILNTILKMTVSMCARVHVDQALVLPGEQ